MWGGLKVLHLLGRFPILYERPILDGIAATQSLGIENFIAAYHPSGEAPFDTAAQFADRVAYLDTARERGRLLSGAAGVVSGLLAAAAAPGSVADALREAPRCLGLKVAVFWRRMRLARWMGRIRPDIVHAQFGHLGLLALPVTRALGVPLVVSFRGGDVCMVQQVPSGERDALFRGASIVMVRSLCMQNEIIRLGCPREKVHVLPTGIDVAAIPFAERRPPAVESDRVFLIAGRLVPKKGIADALRAVAVSCPGASGPQVRIAGDGPEDPALRRLCDELGLGERVEFLGRVPPDVLIGEMGRAHMFLLPCRTAPDGETEGIPNVLKEAQAAGLPVISTRHAGIPECVEHGVTGLLAKEGDVEEIAANLSSLLAHPAWWPVMGRQGRRRMLARYNLPTLADELADVYHTLLV